MTMLTAVLLIVLFISAILFTNRQPWEPEE